MVHLQNGHLILNNALFATLWGDITHTHWVYYKQRNLILMADATDEVFKQLHKSGLGILKLKNSKGDKSMSVQELIIENDLNNKDRALKYGIDTAMQLLTIFIY